MRIDGKRGRPQLPAPVNREQRTRRGHLRRSIVKLACGAAALCCLPALAIQVLEAVDHAELEAAISATAVNRVALDGDRIVRVVRAPDGLTVEHDPVRGDVYIHPGRRSGEAGAPVVLYLGTERGFTYRLSLHLAERDSAQVLIRNGAVAQESCTRQPCGQQTGGQQAGGQADSRSEELVGLVLAVARKEPPAGYEVEPARTPGAGGEGVRLVETWRGPRWTARVLAVADGGPADAAELAAQQGARAAAAWVSATARGPDGARPAAVVEPADAPGTGR